MRFSRPESAQRARLTLLRPPQAHVFELAGRSTVDALLEGYSGCIIAYGQARASRAAHCRRMAQHKQLRAPAGAHLASERTAARAELADCELTAG
jgi:hypothetical protein